MLDDAIKLLKDGKFDAALVLFKRIMTDDPSNAFAFGNAALCHACRGEFGEAISLTKQALDKQPNNFMFLSNLAGFYNETGELEQSLSYMRACQAVKESPDGWSRMGLLYWDLKQFDEAQKAFEKALTFDQSNVNMHVNLGLLHLMHGRFKEGFSEYQWRIDPNSPMEHYLRCYGMRKCWDRTDLTGKRFLVYGEQGLGDIIQFSRYLSELKARGATVIFHCPETLADLMKPLADELFTKDIEKCRASDLPPYDFQCCSMSLPYYLDSYEPSGKPYLALERHGWEHGNFCSSKLKVGVVWGGSPDHVNDAVRSVPFEEFSKLFVTGPDFFCLQVGVDKSKLGGFKIQDVSDQLKTFSHTASMLKDMDLVVACDTAVVHLAGAMGIPCWLLVPYNSDWRWGFGERSCWYDSVRIFRQPSRNDWSSVIDVVKKELEAFQKEHTILCGSK